jgi:hypothetical protein
VGFVKEFGFCPTKGSRKLVGFKLFNAKTCLHFTGSLSLPARLDSGKCWVMDQEEEQGGYEERKG